MSVIRFAARQLVVTPTAVVTLLNAIPAAYLATITVSGCRRPRAPLTATPTSRFVIMVPAHNEALGIAPTLESFRDLDYPAHQFAVHVVADNCTDSTADVVRQHGWNAHERTDLDTPGKGPALNWLFDRLIEQGEVFDASIVVDADSVLDRRFLAAMDRALANGAVAAQGYYSVRDAGASPAQSFRFAALACRHFLRPLGRRRLGASSGLFGNGMMFRRDLLARHRWTGHLVEDAEFQMTLLDEGTLVEFVPDAVLEAEMPNTLDQSATQNARWERGRIDLARRFVPTLARRAVRDSRHRVARIDAIADHLIPPLSVVAVSNVIGMALSMFAVTTIGGPRARSLAVANAAATAVLVVHVVAGLRAVDAPVAHYRSLLAAPRVVLWKCSLWARQFTTGDVAWVRTRRNTET